MKDYSWFVIIVCIVFIVSSCSSSSSSDSSTASTDNTTITTDNTTTSSAPVIAEVKGITTPTSNSYPNYTFSSTKAGTITCGCSCFEYSSLTATTGNNTITFHLPSALTYTCSIRVEDSEPLLSNKLAPTVTVVQSKMGGSIQSGEELSLTKEVTTLGDGFNYPYGLTTDGTNLFLSNYYDNIILMIALSTGVVTTLAGSGSTGSTDGTGTSASFNGPNGITTADYVEKVDGSNLYVVDSGNHTIRKIVVHTGVVTTFAGTGSAGSADNATGTLASFNDPKGITSDGTNLYVADYSNNLIRKIVIDNGTVTTFAGSRGSTGSTDGTGTSASFNGPWSITTDGTNLYVGEHSTKIVNGVAVSDNERIRKIVISTGVVTTFAGTGSAGSVNGTGTSASFDAPIGITTDGTNLFVSDSNNYLIRKIVISTGVVTTEISNSVGFSDNNYLKFPAGITTDGTNLYMGDRSKVYQIE